MEPPRYTSAPQMGGPPARQMKRPSVAPASSMQRFVFPFLVFIGGVLVGIAGLSIAVLLGNGDRPSVAVPPASQDAALVVQASSTYVNQIAQQKAGTLGMPGNVKNVHVTFVHNGPVVVTGDDEIGLLGLTMTRHFTLNVQLYANACKPTIHVLQANFDGVPITGFVASFEQNINEQLQSNLSGLPPGFIYCITSISTEPQGPVVTFSAQPMS
ncbi:MAG TPA: hypothetical protein VGN34_27300 [Ktedonobacteraceae bacterium]